MNILLTAANGFTGSRILPALLAAGHDVIAHVHTERSRAAFAPDYPGIPVVVGDAANVERMSAIPHGIDAVIYLPGLLREFPSKGTSFQHTHVEGVRTLLDVAKRAGATRWIQMSALGVKPDATTGYYRTKWAAEQLVGESGFDWTILRPSVIFDDRPTKLKTFVNELAGVLRKAPFIPILGNGQFRMQPVSLDDVSQTIVQSLSKPETIGKTYELGGPDKLSYTEIIHIIAKAIGARKPSIHIPFVLAEAAARLFQQFSFFPFTLDQLTMLKEENIVHSPESEREWQSTFNLLLKRFADTIERSLQV